MKSQTIRLLDVFVLGPLMIYVAQQAKPSRRMRQALVITGLATILYNGANYLKREAGGGIDP